MPSPNSNCKMNPNRLKAIRDVLRALADELDSEIHSDIETYTLNLNYEEVRDYLNDNDDDGATD